MTALPASMIPTTTDPAPALRPDSLESEKIVRACLKHNIDAWATADGRVFADAMIAGSDATEELTGYTFGELYRWLGY